jgi:nucleotide-binding universal stress UspA family protein
MHIIQRQAARGVHWIISPSTTQELTMYKTILVHVDASTSSPMRVEVAARLAVAHEAHLIGSALTGLSAFMFPISVMGAGMPPIAFPVEELRAGADRMLDRFESGARQFPLNSVERRRLDDDPGVGLCLQARYADLVVISRMTAHEADPLSASGFAQYVVLHCARPVLVLPPAGFSTEIGKRVTVAWNGSPQAVRAVTSALPLLRRAEQVQLVVFGKDDDPGLHGEEPGADIALYLARHGIKVEVTAQSDGGDDGAALLSFAAEKGADLIVMGAYGHSRLSEFILGGATHTALHSSPLPLWMAH